MVNALTTTTSSGNAAAVCPLTDWLPDEALLKITQQHNQSGTTFFVTDENGFESRWFTTQGEINLCGRAMLATVRVIFEYLDYLDTETQSAIRFVRPSTVMRCGEWLTLDFPTRPSKSAVPPALLLETLGITEYREVRVTGDCMAMLENRQQVEAVHPDIRVMLPLGKVVCITAPGDGEYDFVSCLFCPGEAVAEDPVTGPAHNMLVPYWAGKLNKTQILARQASERNGDLRCQLAGTCVYISRQAIAYLTGKVLSC